MSWFTLSALVCGIAVAQGASTSDCDSAFSLGSISATSTGEKCRVINVYEACLTAADGSSAASATMVNAAKSANGGCIVPTVKPSFQANGGQLAAVVDASADFCVERAGLPSVCMGGLQDSVDTKLASVDAKLVESATATSAALKAAAASLDVKSQKSADDVSTAIASIDDKLAKAASATQGKLDVMTNNIAATSNTMDQKITAFETTSAKTSKANLAALESKLLVKIKVLEDGAKCNFRGEVKDGKCVNCDEGWTGDTCAIKLKGTCEDYKDTDGARTIKGVASYCYKGWTMAFNLATDQKPAQEYRASFWTEAGKVLNTPTLKKDCKTKAFNDKRDATKVLIMAHYRGSQLGTAEYTISSGKGKSMQELFKGGAITWTGKRTAKTGQLRNKLRHNPDRPQPLWGDLFVDTYTDALVINKQKGWSASQNQNRIATTLNNGNYQHTFAGLGGYHHMSGGWKTYYEAAPVTSYCGAKRGYGNDNVMNGGVSSSGLSNGCRSSFAWVKADFAIFLK